MIWQQQFAMFLYVNIHTTITCNRMLMWLEICFFCVHLICWKMKTNENNGQVKTIYHRIHFWMFFRKSALDFNPIWLLLDRFSDAFHSRNYSTVYQSIKLKRLRKKSLASRNNEAPYRKPNTCSHRWYSILKHHLSQFMSPNAHFFIFRHKTQGNTLIWR